MPPLRRIAFCSRNTSNSGMICPARGLRLGNAASAGMFQVLPVKKAPSIFPEAQ